ncbi:MAG: 5-formyltetrahydrofolate cyclo-ligase [Acutalibacteraceae bacterium]
MKPPVSGSRLAFDRDGYRLGFGKGYYDRFCPRFGPYVGLL